MSTPMSLSPMPLLPVTSPRTLDLCKNYSPSNDIFIASYPKSGTTWMQCIIFSLLNAKAAQPLTHISDYCPFFEVDRTWEAESDLVREGYRDGHKRLGRCVFNTHLRWEMMPHDADTAAGARYIYLVRNAKDACVSFYHHLTNQSVEDGGFEGSWEKFLEAWCVGDVPFGLWIDHLLSWSEALKDKRVLLVHYEDLKSDLAGSVKRVMEHCGLELTPHELEHALSCVTFEYMSKNHELFQPRSVEWRNPEFRFIRKGAVGDHHSLFSEANRERFLKMVHDRFGEEEPPELIRQKASNDIE